MQKEDQTNPVLADQKPDSSLSPEPAAQTAPKTPGGVAEPLAPVATPPTAAAVPTAAVEYAGFWIRFLAAIIDSVLLGIVTGIINSIFGAGFTFAPGLTSGNPSTGTVGFFAGLMGLSLIINLVINWGYYVILTGSYGATLGKMILGLRVVDANSQKIGIPRAALREIVGKFVSGIIFALGYIWVAFDEKKQGWHDKIANTYVVKIR